MKDEIVKIENCRVAMKAALEAIQDYCGTGETEEVPEEPVIDTAKASKFRGALRATLISLCDYCGASKLTYGMISELPNLAEIIDDPDLFTDALDKMCKKAPAGVKDATKAAECREALQVTLIALCDYCETERPDNYMLRSLAHLADEMDDRDAFMAELGRTCRQS